jgi:predicted ribosomally synthesized peptide with nif11-like leader
MSQVHEFLNRVSTDSDFRHSLESAESSDAKRRILDQNGFQGLSRADIESQLSKGGSELSDQELEVVAGGSTASWVSVSLAAIALALA